MSRSRYGIHPMWGYALTGVAAVAVTATVFLARENRLPAPEDRTPVEGPLRPPPPDPEDPEPGPLAKELSAFIDSLSDSEVRSLREAIPAEWWEYAVLATYAPTDDIFRFAFHPLTVSFSMLDEDDYSQLKRDLLWAIGPGDAMDLKGFLVKAGVLPGDAS